MSEPKRGVSEDLAGSHRCAVCNWLWTATTPHTCERDEETSSLRGGTRRSRWGDLKRFRASAQGKADVRSLQASGTGTRPHAPSLISSHRGAGLAATAVVWLRTAPYAAAQTVTPFTALRCLPLWLFLSMSWPTASMFRVPPRPLRNLLMGVGR